MWNPSFSMVMRGLQQKRLLVDMNVRHCFIKEWSRRRSIDRRRRSWMMGSSGHNFLRRSCVMLSHQRSSRKRLLKAELYRGPVACKDSKCRRMGSLRTWSRIKVSKGRMLRRYMEAYSQLLMRKSEPALSCRMPSWNQKAMAANTFGCALTSTKLSQLRRATKHLHTTRLVRNSHFSSRIETLLQPCRMSRLQNLTPKSNNP